MHKTFFGKRPLCFCDSYMILLVIKWLVDWFRRVTFVETHCCNKDVCKSEPTQRFGSRTWQEELSCVHRGENVAETTVHLSGPINQHSGKREKW